MVVDTAIYLAVSLPWVSGRIGVGKVSLSSCSETRDDVIQIDDGSEATPPEDVAPLPPSEIHESETIHRAQVDHLHHCRSILIIIENIRHPTKLGGKSEEAHTCLVSSKDESGPALFPSVKELLCQV